MQKHQRSVYTSLCQMIFSLKQEADFTLKLDEQFSNSQANTVTFLETFFFSVFTIKYCQQK